ncbi:MAG: hypothetical protein OHK006_04510 [Thermodesulfovibrionales bacterium]
MKTRRAAFGLALALILTTAALAGGKARTVFFRDDFTDLSGWRPLTFPKIGKHTVYSIEQEGSESYLKAESSASASGLVLAKDFPVHEFPRARWRWKVSTVFMQADPHAKSGDDYPIRVYVLFRYNPAQATVGQRIRYGLAKAFYGEYPPHSSLSYVWAGKASVTGPYPNPYAAEAMMVPLEAGDEKAGQWVDEEVDIRADYRRAFGHDPPPSAGLAVMSDSDNTGGSATAWLDFIEVFR